MPHGAAWALKPPLDLGLKPIKNRQTLVGSSPSPFLLIGFQCFQQYRQTGYWPRESLQS